MSPAPPSSHPAPGHVVTVGTFDGVHLGHRALVARAADLARRIGPNIRVAALVFDPNPIEALRPGSAPARLTTFETKARLLRQAGADEVHRLQPTRELLDESPEQFLRQIGGQLHVVGIVEGPDFRFGKGRAGGIDTLRELGPRLGFIPEIVDPVSVSLNDHTLAPARSTMVRWLLARGRVADAARILARPHVLTGQVVSGDRRGRTIGFPTANLDHAEVPPEDGVYAGSARLADGRTFPAAISVGTKPTFSGSARTVEAVLLTHEWESGHPWATLPGLPEYGWPLELEFLGWIREQLRFAGLQPLIEQMHRDCRRVIQIARAPHAAAQPLPA